MFEDASGDPGFALTFETALLADLGNASKQGVNSQIKLAKYTCAGKLVAGLAATTSYGWLHVNMLWVAQDLRRSGLGRKLMQEALEQSVKRGCHSAWLETSSPGARTFYLNLGFEEFGMLSNSAEMICSDHQRWFLKRGYR